MQRPLAARSTTRRRAILQAAAWLAAAAARAAESQLPELAVAASDGATILAADPAANRWRAAWIDIWASWCGPCKLSFPWMNEMHDRYAAAGLRIVAINVDRNATDAQRFLSQHPARFALAMDAAGQTAHRLDAKAMPSSWLVRPDRTLLLSHSGFRLDDRPELERRIRGALGL